MSSSRMLLRNKALYGDRWLLALPDRGVVGRFSWPVVAHTIGNSQYFTLCPEATLEAAPLLHVFELANWEAFAIEWMSPASVKSISPELQCSVHGPVAKRVGDACELLTFAAKNAFFDLSKGSLDMLAKAIGCEADPSHFFLQRVQTLMKFVLGLPRIGAISPNRAWPL